MLVGSGLAISRDRVGWLWWGVCCENDQLGSCSHREGGTGLSGWTVLPGEQGCEVQGDGVCVQEASSGATVNGDPAMWALSAVLN